MTQRLHPSDRKAQILECALKLAKRQGGVHTLTREAIAAKVKVSPALVSLYMGTMDELRGNVMRAAIAQEIPEVVGAGLALGDKVAQRAPDKLKRKALALLAGVAS